MSKVTRKSFIITRDDLCSYLFLAAVPLLQIRMFWTHVSFINNYLIFFDIASLSILLLATLLILFSKKQSFIRLLIMVGLSAAAIASYFFTKSSYLSYLILFSLASASTPFPRLLKVDLISKIVTIIAMPIMQSMGLTDERTFYREGIERISFGFSHPNTLGFISVIICIECLCLLREKRGKNAMILRVVIPAVLLYLCAIADSRTAMVAIIVFAIYSIIDAADGKNRKVEARIKGKKRIIILSLPILLLLACIMTTKAYENGSQWAMKVDDALSTRVRLQSAYEEKYDVLPFGSREIDEKAKIVPIDNGFYHVMYINGYIGLITLLVIIELALWRACETRKDINLFALILLLFYSLSEWDVFRIAMTPFWAFAFNKKKKTSYEEKSS